MNALTTKLHDFFVRTGTDKNYWLALSGGLDSTALLFLILSLREKLSICFNVIHINHNVHSHADDWLTHCQRICLQNDIQFFEKKIEIDKNSPLGFEAAARLLRYQAFADFMGEGDVLLTAHHEDDQAETLLLQLLRGAGVKGMAAMPPIKPFLKGQHARPLLDVKRAQLAAYVKSEHLSFIEDDSNFDRKYARNFLRHEVMPVLEKRYPAVSKTLARAARHALQSQVLLEEYALVLLMQCKGSEAGQLSVSKLLCLTEPQQQLLLRHWIDRQGLNLPDALTIEIIQREVLRAAADRNPSLYFHQAYEIRRFRDDLMLVKALQPPHYPEVLAWNLNAPLTIPTLGVMHAAFKKGEGLLPRNDVSVRFRKGGEKVSYAGRGRRTLKNLLQEWGVPPYLRERLPLIYFGEQLVCVVGFYTDTRFLAKADEMGFHPHFTAF